MPALAEINADPDVMRYIGDGRPRSLQKTQEGLARQMRSQAEKGYCMWALEMKDSGEVVGLCGLLDFTDGEVETGWRLAKDYWGRGLATEAAFHVKQFAFETLKLPRIIAIAHPPNSASINIMKKLGMQFMKVTDFEGVEVVYYAVENPVSASS